MAQIINTKTLKKDELSYSHEQQVYNAMDCCLTKEIADTLRPQLRESPESSLIYKFEKALRGPVLEMQMRGIKVNLNQRTRMIHHCENEIEKLRGILNTIIFELLGWVEDNKGWRLNPGSPAALKYFFYGVLKLPIHNKWDKGERKATVNREALEKFQESESFPIDYICTLMLKIRDLGKTVGTLRWGVEKDGRMRFSYGIASTESGRFTSSANIFGRGGNAQQLAQKIRGIFVADDGRKFAYVDLKNAESRVVGYLAGDEKYIGANESSLKVHTYVAQMVWDELEWPDDPGAATEMAQKPYYRDYSYYDLAKRGSHLSNYAGQPPTMAKGLKIDKSLAEDFQARYFSAFSGIQRWHKRVAAVLQTEGVLLTPLGRRRRFFGRLDDKATLREAVAFVPQSTVADLLNLAMYRVWRDFFPQVRVISQLHDAILIDYPEAEENAILPRILDVMEIPIMVEGIDGVEREMSIPADAAVGWNWRENKKPKDFEENPDGLVGWSPDSPDSRSRQVPADIPMEEIIL